MGKQFDSFVKWHLTTISKKWHWITFPISSNLNYEKNNIMHWLCTSVSWGLISIFSDHRVNKFGVIIKCV